MPAELVVLSRLVGKVAEDGSCTFQQNEGEYLQSIADRLGTLTLVAPVVFEGSEEFRRLPVYSFQFRDNVKVVRAKHPGSYDMFDKARVAVDNVWRVLRISSSKVFFYLFLPHPWWLVVASLTTKPFATYIGSDLRAVLSHHKRGTALAPVVEAFMRTAVRRSRFALVTGVELQRRYARYGKTFLAAPISLLSPHGDTVRKPERAPGAVRRVLSVGALISRKRVDLTIQALSELVSRGMPVELVIVGSGPEEHRLREQASALGVADRIRWLGYIADAKRLQQVYDEADVLVVASDAEGFPRVIWEAILAGVPVVARRLISLDGTLLHRKHILFVDGESPAAFADAISDILIQPGLAAELISNAQARWRELIPESDPVQQFMNLLRKYAPEVLVD